MYFKPDKKIILDIIINIKKCDVMIVNIEVLTICRYRREYEKNGCENHFIGVYDGLIDNASERRTNLKRCK